MIWFKPFTIDMLNSRPANHLGGLLDIRFTRAGEDELEATMPVDDRTRQPAGILHGGASAVLAETLGSVASTLCIDTDKYMAVGLEINANHLRPVKSGLVRGVCKMVHRGAKTHVWDIRIVDERGKMNCISRLTVAIVPRPAA
ncbi:esterase [Pedobacter yulinensis]|uniref:Esterase n=1 Tax=Pedobacter yulinensis TaxID=2126353 RepID=A0A2T3HRV0_9SPHI|nr:hotdog fold thioesterase [Pedobacter yulinensis]PST85136.1 esterase [Pedobacter yulinensis]